MKRNLFAMAALAAIAGGAHAQSTVTVYGLMDAGVEYVNHASADGGKVLRLTSGGMNTSRFGLRGTEDLGGGLKAVFQLESGMFIDTGAIDGVFWKRQANVGLDGGFGRVVIGRSFTTTYDFMLPFDPMGYAPSYSWVTSGSGTPPVGAAPNKYGMITAFDNIIKYQGTFGGVKLGASYGLGEAAGNTGDNAKYTLGAAYAGGPFSIGATVDRINGTPVAATGNRDKTSTVHVGAAYDFASKFTLKGGYRYYKREFGAAATADARANTFWGGVTYLATPALALTGAVYYQDVKNVPAGTDADPIMYVLRAKYALSKRTDLYAVTAYAKAKNGQAIGLTRDSSADGGVTGFSSNQTGVMLGVQHRF